MKIKLEDDIQTLLNDLEFCWTVEEMLKVMQEKHSVNFMDLCSDLPSILRAVILTINDPSVDNIDFLRYTLLNSICEEDKND